MIKVKIDSAECNFTPSDSLALSYDSVALRELERNRSGFALSFTMELNEVNRAIFGGAADVHPLSKFNSERHAMTLEMDGITLVRGTAYLMQTIWKRERQYLVVECRSGAARWVENVARKLFKEIDLPFEGLLTEQQFKENWDSDSPVKFFPVTRDSYSPEGASEDVTGVRLIRSLDDYHPFIQLSALLEAIFEEQGYTLQSATKADEAFEDLYISGNYNYGGSTAARQEAMGFFAKRTESATTTANSIGIIDCSPYISPGSVGNIVDIDSIEQEHECYNRGGCLQLDNQALIYRPLTATCVGFEIYLHYTCDCYIESRTKMKGIDSFNILKHNYEIEWEISNRYVDQRDNLASGLEYKLFIFDFDDEYEYKLLGEDESGSLQEVIGWSGTRVTSAVIQGNFINLRLYERGNGNYRFSDKEWAIYNGYVEEVIPTEVKVTFRTQAKECSPTSPIEFQTAKLKGAMAGANFTLHEDCSMRPYFSNYPSFNSPVSYEQIAQQPYSALDFLNSLQHLFNLRFFTNDASKSVTIESFDKFYNDGTWDWSDKVLQEESIEFSDMAHLAHRTTTYGYQMADGAVNRQNDDNDEIFGRWSVEVESYAASPATRTLLNPLFSAAICDERGVLQVGNRDDVQNIDSLSFEPRIVKMLGMTPLEDENYMVPHIAFHSAEDNFTLCFEDRDDVPGLNRLYAKEFEQLQRQQIISLSLRLTAMDYSNLFEPSGFSASLRSIFHLTLHGESFRTTLYSIESYNLATGLARCKFLTID